MSIEGCEFSAELTHLRLQSCERKIFGKFSLFSELFRASWRIMTHSLGGLHAIARCKVDCVALKRESTPPSSPHWFESATRFCRGFFSCFNMRFLNSPFLYLSATFVWSFIRDEPSQSENHPATPAKATSSSNFLDSEGFPWRFHHLVKSERERKKHEQAKRKELHIPSLGVAFRVSRKRKSFFFFRFFVGDACDVLKRKFVYLGVHRPPASDFSSSLSLQAKL